MLTHSHLYKTKAFVSHKLSGIVSHNKYGVAVSHDKYGVSVSHNECGVTVSHNRYGVTVSHNEYDWTVSENTYHNSFYFAHNVATMSEDSILFPIFLNLISIQPHPLNLSRDITDQTNQLTNHRPTNQSQTKHTN